MNHRWRLARVGGIDQVLFHAPEDLLAIGDLDQKLWVALACPIDGVVIDKTTLERMDLDKDRRIRATELLEAVSFVKASLQKLDGVAKGSPEVALASIKDEAISAAARRVALDLGKAASTTVTLPDVAEVIKRFSALPLNGDGIVTSDSTNESGLQQLIGEIVASVGGLPDRSGKPGVDKAKADAFFSDIAAANAWLAKGDAEGLRPLGAATDACWAAVSAIRAKMDDYFVRCRLAAVDDRNAVLMNRDDAELKAIAVQDLAASLESVAKLPLARVDRSGVLDLGAVNPAWQTACEALRANSIVPILGERSTLDEAGWKKILGTLAAFSAWQAEKPNVSALKLPAERVRALALPAVRDSLIALIASDAAKSAEFAELEKLEKLIRYQRDLKVLLENFVSFADFYHPQRLAVFQAGHLYIDGRTADLCIPVEDVGKHSTLATPSKMYLAYCELFRKATNEKRTICAAFTSGIAETLFVGRNGVFYDRDHKDWDATIVKVVEAPVSLREAFWSPWKKIGKMIGEQVQKLMASREAAVQDAASKDVSGAGTAVETGKPLPPPPGASSAGGAAIASSVAAIGIAIGFLSTAVASMLGAIAGLPLWKTALGLIGLLLLVSGPSVVIAYFRLRQRDLAPVLNASGWAINARLNVNPKLGHKLTHLPMLPKGATRELRDPYAEPTARRNTLIALLMIVIAMCGLYYFGVLDPIIDHVMALLKPPPPPAP